jgi:NADPH-dependent 2,4-dienoyl-CoA reductase/sulfur reductase-like enzyme
MAAPRVIVVGAGPAGIRAAAVLVEAGLRPVVVDEAATSGGQIYRRQPLNFLRKAKALYGTEAQKATALHATFDGLQDRVDYRPETLAWNVYEGALHVVQGTRAERLPFDALIIAAGATDRLMPLPGWTLPGVYSLGAAQIALKAQACSIGRQVVFLGTGPLLYLVAAQYVKAGASVAGVLDTSDHGGRLRALPELGARPGTLLKGATLLWALRRRGVRMLHGVTPLRIEPGPAGDVGAVVVRLEDGHEERIACDAVGLGYHLRPETQLADLARCTFRFDEATRQWLPETDLDGRASVPGVYLAGDGARILGADGAENAGRLAAYAVLADLGRDVPRDAVRRLRRSQRVMDRFRRGLARAFPWPARLAPSLTDETLVCRCEAITAGELRKVATAKGAPEVNRAKAFSRVGMGRCQGRYCGHAAAEVLAEALGVPVEQVGRLRGQAPVKPLPIATIFEEAAP